MWHNEAQVAVDPSGKAAFRTSCWLVCKDAGGITLRPQCCWDALAMSCSTVLDSALQILFSSLVLRVETSSVV